MSTSTLIPLISVESCVGLAMEDRGSQEHLVCISVTASLYLKSSDQGEGVGPELS